MEIKLWRGSKVTYHAETTTDVLAKSGLIVVGLKKALILVCIINKNVAFSVHYTDNLTNIKNNLKSYQHITNGGSKKSMQINLNAIGKGQKKPRIEKGTLPDATEEDLEE